MIVCPADWDAADAEEDLDAVAHRAVAEWSPSGGSTVDGGAIAQCEGI